MHNFYKTCSNRSVWLIFFFISFILSVFLSCSKVKDHKEISSQNMNKQSASSNQTGLTDTSASSMFNPDSLDTILYSFKGLISPQGTHDSLNVRFVGKNLQAQLIYEFFVLDTVFTIKIDACQFPESEYYFQNLGGCFKNIAKFVEGIVISTLDVNSYFFKNPTQYDNDGMPADIKLNDSLWAQGELAAFIKNGFDADSLSYNDSLLSEILNELYCGGKRVQIVVRGPYEYMDTYAWSNVMKRPIFISSPYGP